MTNKDKAWTAFGKFMQILGKVYFVGHTARAGTATRFFFREFGFCCKVRLNKLSDAGQE